jgi:hypothetical protein
MLFLPTRDEDVSTIYTDVEFKRGQLYNIDNNQYLNFQFNPTSFEWARDVKWSERNWVGSTRGGDVQFINIGPRRLSLELLFVADPRAPEVNFEADFPVIDQHGLVDFKSITDTIENWIELIEGVKRPSRIGIIVGPNVFEGVLLNITPRITDFFEDLSAKEALLLLEFREWLLV